MEGYDEKAGLIEIKLTFWSGLSEYDSKLANKDVMDGYCADNDEIDLNDEDTKAESDGESSSDSGSGSGSHSAGEMTPITRNGASSESLESNRERGMVNQVKDYKAHRKVNAAESES